jgi:poly(hydroxyalkanoate) depolymerase family esterase
MRALIVALVAVTGCSAHRASGGGSDGGGVVAGTWVNGTFANDQGQRDYALYVPVGYRAGTPMPLVTVLHGCTISADGMDQATRYSALADARGFLVVYPEQSSSANATLCWNWFDPANQSRGQGEPSIIAGITNRVIDQYGADRARSFVIGISAGGAMSVVMGATYPDAYAAIGVVAGCEYGGFPCGASGGPDPATQGQKAYQAMAANARVVPVVAFQGDADNVVPPVNGQQVTAQWIATDDWADDGMHDGSIAAAAASTKMLTVPSGRSYELDEWLDGSGAPLVDYYLVHGAGHAWPGGAPSAPFTDPSGPDASNISLDFFFAHARR